MTGRHALGASLIVTALCSVLLFILIVQGQSRFSYVLDDPYIHLSMGRNLAQTGMMGINAKEVSFSTSSLGWTLLMVIPHFFVQDATFFPLILSFLCALLIVFLTSRLFSSLPPLSLLCLLLGLAALVPLVPLVFTGMEHLLHIALLAGLFLFMAKNWPDSRVTTVPFLPLLLFFTLLPAVRLESLFLLFPLALLLPGFSVIQRLGLFVASMVLPLATGVIFHRFGWYLLPNSILAKTLFAQHGDPLWLKPFLFPYKLLRTPHLLVPFVVGGYLFVTRFHKIQHRSMVFLGMALLGTMGHLSFSQTGWFFRYEAYLVFTYTVAFTFVFMEIPFHRKRLVIPLLLLLAIFRAISSHGAVVRASRNIHDQQLQLSKFFAGARVGVNDVGAISYYAGGYVLDLWGLASMEVMKLRQNNAHGGTPLARIAQEHDIELVALFPSWFSGRLPPSWIPMGQFTIAGNIICGDSRVLILATSYKSHLRWRNKLHIFFKTLPERTVHSFFVQ
ncbi:hypothetical protein KKF84_17360 [Myxococcota bacterium]|nr:hypothetical protein [Myxococcota bacterium]MBU1537096.1 hypothetical protein [Myxococcota bacterium]